ncbi:MAG TPA: MFS transporter, partial [Ramlibacter sp.]|nr:MFS transporter [Ramlibacter sp.]
MTTAVASRPMSPEEKKVIFASSLGTVFEWYDFYLYGSLAAIIAKQFFSGLDSGSAFIFALLAFAAGFIVRPFGAIFFGRLGDMIGRKYTFLVTILIMGLSTFIVGILPNYATIGVAAPVILIALRLLQGLALGGEYGGAATYVAEHSPQNKRGAYTAWIQTTATLGLFLSLMVILGTQTLLGPVAFADWGWRVPFIASVFLLAISVWIRLSMNESPAFKKMKAEGRTSKAPLTESFGQWKNLKIVILALVGLTAGQAVVWYSGQFYALFFLTQALKVDGPTANILVAVSLLVGTP